MRYAEKLDQLPVAGKAEEMRLIQVNMLVLLNWSIRSQSQVVVFNAIESMDQFECKFRLSGEKLIF